MSHWWRAYDDAIDNPKLLKLSDALHRAWFTLQCIASANEGKLPPADDIATRLRIKPAKVAEWITRLVQAKLMDQVDGVFIPHNWKDRQFISDSSTPRVKRFRDRQRNVSGNVTQPLHETAPEAEAKTDTETEQSKAEARELDEMGLKQEGMLKAAFTAECSGRAVFPDMSIIKTWLLAGIAVATISNTVTPILRRKQDMKSLVYCDAAVREAHGKVPARSEPEIDRSNWAIVVEGTNEHTCWNIIRKEQKLPPLFMCTQIGEGGRVYDRAAKCPTPYPPEFNDFGERLPPSAEDAA